MSLQVGPPPRPKLLVHWADKTYRDENASEMGARQDMARSQRNVLRVIYNLEGVWKRMNVLRNDGQESGFEMRLVKPVGQMMKSVSPSLQRCTTIILKLLLVMKDFSY